MSTAVKAGDELREAIDADDLIAASHILSDIAPQEIASLFEQMESYPRAVAYRLLTKDRALDVFEHMDAAAQSELITLLREDEVTSVFDSLDPDDRVELLDELPAKVAKQLVRELSPQERDVTAVILGYPRGSVGRRMSPEFVHVFPDDTLARALERVRVRGMESETIYTVPVIGTSRGLEGVISLKDLFLMPSEDLVADHMASPIFAFADDDAESAARRCVDRHVLALPIVDHEERLLGLLTIDDATRIVEAARDEDAARAGAMEPLRRPYLLTPVLHLARSRIVWLLVLGISAILTVNVLQIFETTLEQLTALALFIPLLTGIGGNTGSQAATTVTRALAVDEAQPKDVGKVALKEVRTGLLLGIVLGAVGWLVATPVFGNGIGVVISLTLISICTIAATVGGTMPLLAKAIRVDPAVFSTPFISTFCDATGLIVYFMIARAVLSI